MQRYLAGAAALALFAGAAHAGGIDRSLNPYNVMFESGNYVELSYSSVSPSVSGDYPGAVGGGSTGDMARSYTLPGFAFKSDLSEKFSLGLFVNQPYGAKSKYSQGFYNGLEATWQSDQVAAVMRYKIDDSWSVHGGIRAVKSNARIAIPDSLPRAGFTVRKTEVDGQIAALQSLPSLTPTQAATLSALQAGSAQLGALIASPAGALDYSAFGSGDTETGYILGVAYERPEIALRVALTYESGVTHQIPTTENWAAPFAGAGGTLATTTEIDMPASLKLDFQSGVAANTLVFGSIRWSEWSQWSVEPPGYVGVTGTEVVSFDNNVYTYQLGVARRFNEAFSGFARVTYEKSNGGVASRLAPTDGSTAFGLGVRFTRDNLSVTTGVEYVQVGDAVDGTGTQFTDNDAIGFGVTVGVRF